MTEKTERESLELINEFFYGVRIFPGQDPNLVYVGWVNTQYHIHSRDFSQDMVRVVTIQQLDSYGRIQQSLDRQSCYMVRTDELYGEVSNDPSGKTPSQGLFIGCFVDTSTGVISFTCEGKETRQKFRMEPGVKLFPAIFFKVEQGGRRTQKMVLLSIIPLLFFPLRLRARTRFSSSSVALPAASRSPRPSSSIRESTASRSSRPD